MPLRPRTTVLAACLTAAALGAGVPLALSSSRSAATQAPAAVAAVTLPGLAPASGEPTLAGVTTAHPAPGTVVRAAGPFDDRFTLTGLRLARGTLSGTLTVTSDVSEVIDLQVLVGFHDARGALLATATYEKHGEGARPDEVVRFTVTAPAGVQARTVSASVGVPVLVNE